MVDRDVLPTALSAISVTDPDCGPELITGDVFGAVDSDDDVLAGGAAMAVIDLHREGEHQLVVIAQEVEGAIIDVVVPADRAGAVGLRMRRRINREGIQQRVLLRRRQRVAVRQRGAGYLRVR